MSLCRKLKELRKSIDFLGGNFSYDDFGQMVFAEVEGKGPMRVLDIRGWGFIQKLPNPEEKQDSFGECVTILLNNLDDIIEILEEKELEYAEEES